MAMPAVTDPKISPKTITPHQKPMVTQVDMRCRKVRSVIPAKRKLVNTMVYESVLWFLISFFSYTKN
uniref:Uncharacterized protein n=1 Tax=Cucumis melo TaxID=3656 RepID=A0A9I9CUF5_CUCME